MAKKLFPVHVPLHWEVAPGDRPGTIILRLRYKPLSEVLTEGTGGGTTVVLALTPDLVQDLVNDLTGKTATEPRPGRLDS